MFNRSQNCQTIWLEILGFIILCLYLCLNRLLCLPQSTKDYIGMALRNNVLYCVYKLNGAEYEIETDQITKSVPEPAYFDKVDIHR